MIPLSNGYKLEYVAASGALGFFGKGWPWDKPFIWIGQLDPELFAIVAKTVTYRKREGNLCWGRIRLIKGGVLNSFGLINPGYVWWNMRMRKGKRSGNSLIASIFSECKEAPRELAYMAEIFNHLKIIGIEINASRPNIKGSALKNIKRIIRSCEEVKKATSHPLILKLSVVHDIEEILPNIEGIVEAISVNSVPWKIAFPQKVSPLEHLGGGGVSGKAAQKFTWPFLKKLADNTDIPVIASSIWEYGDIKKVRDLGAKAISFGSIFLRYPWRPSRFVRKDIKENRCAG